jgi:hypothetical protein
MFAGVDRQALLNCGINNAKLTTMAVVEELTNPTSLYALASVTRLFS